MFDYNNEYGTKRPPNMILKNEPDWLRFTDPDGDLMDISISVGGIVIQTNDLDDSHIYIPFNSTILVRLKAFLNAL